MVRTLIDVYRHEGFLPDCRMSLCKGWTQGGSNADVLLVDSYIKGLRGAIDWETGYEAIVKDAEVQPPNWNVEGRGSVEDWKTMGFLPINLYEKRTISRSVEYAYNDFCIAQMAQKTGRTEDYEKYIHRSRNWRVLFKQDQTSSINGEDTGFVGFLQPRRRDGEWGHQDPAVCSNLNNFHGCYLSTYMETYEGSPWLYTL
jgi:putative alpha-1,2-mannosidase